MVLISYIQILSYFYNMYVVKKFEIVFFFNVKESNIVPCLHNIRHSYNI